MGHEASGSGWRRILEGEPERVMRLSESAAAVAAAFFPARGGGASTPATSGWSRGLEGDLEWEALELADRVHYWNIPAAAAALRSPIQMEDMFYPTHEDDIQQLLQGPQDERDLDKWLAGECSLSLKDVMAVQTPPNPMLNLLDFIPKDGCKCGPRGARKRRAFPSVSVCFETTRGRRHHLRRNNDHWTLTEVTKLVEGVSKHGVGRWTKLKKGFFSTSIRTAVHLKDKWRNLLKACGIKFTSKRKEKIQKTMLPPLDLSLIEQIKDLASKHPYPRRKNY